jgi:hypothetical protein
MPAGELSNDLIDARYSLHLRSDVLGCLPG